MGLQKAGPVMALSMLLASPVLGAEEPGDIELTPHAGYRFGGSFDDDSGDELELDDAGAWGIAANFRADANTQWELYYGRQNTEITTGGLFAGTPVVDVNVDYFHGGGTYIGAGSRVRPYAVLTIGLSRFAHTDTGDADLDDERFFSASFGAGLRIATGNRLAVRLEGRAFTTFVGSDSRLFCVSGGAENVCLLEADGSTVTQWQVTAGLMLKF